MLHSRIEAAFASCLLCLGFLFTWFGLEEDGEGFRGALRPLASGRLWAQPWPLTVFPEGDLL